MLKNVRAHFPHQIVNQLNSDLVSLIGADNFFDVLTSLLGSSLPFKWLHVFQYSKGETPVGLGNYPNQISYKRGYENYLNFTYVINPTYRAFQFGSNSGVFMIADFIQDGYENIIGTADIDIRIEGSEPIGYRTPGWPKNMMDFIVLINLPNGTAIDLTFLTEMDGKCHKHEKELLEKIFPVLQSVLIKQFEIKPTSYEHNFYPGHEVRFQEFESKILTNREQDVVKLILIGHSSNSIAAKLCVSLSTIKTHRRNIYSKLKISSQAELFNLFLLHLR